MTTDLFDSRLDAALAASPSDLALRFTVFDDRIECEPLDAAEPVRSLLGWVAPSEAIAVGVDAPALARACGATADHGRVRHVQSRDGAHSTTFVRDDHVTIDTSASSGRVPDCCRRALGLATDAPPATMTAFITDAWLQLVARHAVVAQPLDWRRALSLHPAAPSLHCDEFDDIPTPARVADVTRALGRCLDWERFRVVSATLGRVPMIDLDVTSIQWMDAGMFARWSLDHLTARELSLEFLTDHIAADTLDRLWATVMLIGDE